MITTASATSVALRSALRCSFIVGAASIASLSYAAEGDTHFYNDLSAPADMSIFGHDDNLEVDDIPMIACSTLLDVERAGDHVVAIGQRGHVIKASLNDIKSKDYAFDSDKICDRSSKEWRLWQQQAFPTRINLNAASFPTASNGWAVGHDAVITTTKDGGATWTIQYKNPELEKPIIDILFTDTQNGYAVGAYGLFLQTSDGGRSWDFINDDEVLFIDDEYGDADDFHLNSITQLGDGTLFVAGELGVLYRKAPGEDAWEKLQGEYEGSYFGAIPYGKEGIIVHGLRGNVWVSRDRGDNWEQMDTGSTSTLLASAALWNGELIIAGVKGTVFVTEGGGRRLREVENPNNGAITGILPIAVDRVVLTTDKGMQELVLQ